VTSVTKAFGFGKKKDVLESDANKNKPWILW
jgi:hypothetical protein